MLTPQSNQSAGHTWSASWFLLNRCCPQRAPGLRPSSSLTELTPHLPAGLRHLPLPIPTPKPVPGRAAEVILLRCPLEHVPPIRPMAPHCPEAGIEAPWASKVCFHLPLLFDPLPLPPCCLGFYSKTIPKSLVSLAHLSLASVQAFVHSVPTAWNALFSFSHVPSFHLENCLKM